MVVDPEQVVAFHVLRCRMIDLEDAQPVREFPLTQAERIQSGAENVTYTFERYVATVIAGWQLMDHYCPVNRSVCDCN